MRWRVRRIALTAHTLAKPVNEQAESDEVPERSARQGEANRRQRCMQSAGHVRDRRLKGIDAGSAQRGGKRHEPDHWCLQDHDARVRDDVRIHDYDARKASVGDAGGNRTRRWSSRRERGHIPSDVTPLR